MASNRNRYDYLFLGKESNYLSFSDRKRAILAGQLSLLSIFICLAYIPFDYISQNFDSWHIQLTCAALSFASFLLNRNGRHYVAKILLGFSVNMAVFFFGLVEPIEIGMPFLFLVCYLGIISTFGFENRKTAYVFILITSILFIVSIAIDIPSITRKSYSFKATRANIIINFFASAIAIILIGYFLLSVNHTSESSMIENEKMLAKKNDELTKANQELDRFVYSTAHDLRSPISSMRGLINLTKYSKDIDEVKSYIDMMEDRLVNLNKFISDISDYSRNTRLSLKIDSVNLKKVVDEILENLRFYPGAEKITVSVNVPDTLEVISDPTRIQIVLGNLVSNAFKYSDRIKPRPSIKINAINHESEVVISVADNGFGIQQDYLPQIFDMFFQANEKSDGSGLGLYIVKEALEKIRGTIAVTSKLGEGSTFTVTLPKK